MALACVATRANKGVEAPLVTVEVHLSNGLPAFNLVGLPETSVKEAKERVRSAIINAGFEFPMRRITVNLAPADLPKQGGRYDLPIAIGILAASDQIPKKSLDKHEFVGELALSGHIRHCHGLLPVIVEARQQDTALVLPLDNRSEAELVGFNKVYFASHLQGLSEYLHGQSQLPGIEPGLEWINTNDAEPQLCFSDVVGQYQAKLGLEIAAAGNHNLLLLGPPGTGKSMLASRMMQLLPPLNYDEALEVATLHSVAGQFIDPHNFYRRPFRNPHHTSSAISLVGGGSNPKPGEISLAHRGVLFLDEVVEFPRKVLDCLREPMEAGEVVISRAAAKLTFASRFQLIAAMNPSPCGDTNNARATPDQIQRYLSRLSGPFLDRFDLTIEVPRLPDGALTQKTAAAETSKSIALRVKAARESQLARAGVLNSDLTAKQLKQLGNFKQVDLLFLEQSVNKLGLSVRSYHRLQRVARTIADLNKCTNVERRHIAQALGYRAMDRLLNSLKAQY
ncbi:YifB family Mg chelatase-like AAA ATPase [Shewanella eurypsychrophilus]|uniref:YifB family Mg chelatase-like AAA ATPase n=1 Tax=Shewanella eurypsychrophilus TaxID=2593656 RepID=A0ABX6V1B1_9GAMM|nr:MULTISPECIES: YifB family Mg chelatase-like AAA ATPase [Shewanella]QFU21082.1 YifB family Mg chelatase-like AAA ATPase [Shewanella sp. YLB-09]QPG56371.1 YifB family Mg chelatase-like AAA ATPase [Shewanella eurypsychrophilus]